MALGTALVYDEEMTKYKLLWVDPACKIEVPERLTVSHEALVHSGLAGRCVSIPVREATDEDILLVHSKEYLEAVKKTPSMSLEDLMTFTQQYGDVYFHPNIYHCAKIAIGATLQLVDSVMTEKVKNGMALVRPPGHHSQRSAANGFCVFNNVAIAARYAMKDYGVKRVLIVDWDVHHGQGVQYCFEDDPSVLYFSWHRYEHQSFWPNLPESDYDSVGKDKGAGFNINVPWNKVGMDNSDYLAVFFHVLLPVAYEFCPDLVLVCAGFDSAIGDPEGHMCATPDIFAHLTHLLMNLAGGKLCAVLEGGYNLKSLAQSVCQTVHTLLGDPCPPPKELPGPCKSAVESIHCVRSAHKQYWSCFSHAADLPVCEPSSKRCKAEEEKPPTAGGQTSGGLQEEEVVKREGESEEEVVVWPEPPPRPAPPVHTAVVLPGSEAPPHGCMVFTSQPSSHILDRLRESFSEGSDGENALMTLGVLHNLVEEMEKNKILNGMALVGNVSTAMRCAVQHALTTTNRVLLVCVGDGVIPGHVTHDGKAILVQISAMEPEVQESTHHFPVYLKKDCSNVAAFMQAVLTIILPLAYEYNPGLVLLALMPHSGVSHHAWLHLTGLLQGLAHGHTLVLMQEYDKVLVNSTASVLQGNPAPSLGPLGASPPEDMVSLDRLRQRMQQDWKLLQATDGDMGNQINVR